MSSLGVFLIACAALCLHLIAAPTANAQIASAPVSELSAQLAIGQRIYREGIRADGEPLVSIGSAQTRLAGKDVACVKCHRRSGFGSSEGQFTIRPITGPALLQEQSIALHAPRVKAQLGTRVRPPYTEALLARAIDSGLDASGQQLDPVMPRYKFSSAEMTALTAYLFSLSAKPSPGVDESDIHFATVIQPGVSPQKRRAMLDVMNAFVNDKDANVRQEEKRRAAGNMRMYRAYRKWVLHEWELTGPSETWGAQLEGFYKRQPVFALIGGVGHASWQAIHEFSERNEIPTVFPQVDLPVVAGSNNYTFYFSRGVTLEAQVLANFLRDQADSGKILQVYRRDDAGATAAAAFRAALKPGTTLEDVVLDGVADEAFWRTVSAARPGSLVLWTGARDIDGLQVLAGKGSPAIYLSFDMLSGKRPDSAIKAGANIRMVYPSDLPPRHDARLLRNKIWLHNKGIALTDESVQINTEFAMTIVSDVVGHIADSFSRDYFVERVEHVVGQTPMSSVYPQVSLGPGQRFASKGSSIVQWVDGDKQALKPLSGWIVP